MSEATPLKPLEHEWWCQDCRQHFALSPEEKTRLVNAFAALLAVAKGFDRGWHAGVIEIEKLDAQFPGWREWA